MKKYYYKNPWKTGAEKKGFKIRLAVGLALLLLSAAVLIASRLSTPFADWFCFNVYPVFSGIGSRLWGIFPFSAGEILLVLTVIGGIAGIVCLIIYIKRKKGSRFRAFLGGFSYFWLFGAVIALLLTFNCLVGYSRTPFSQYSGLILGKYTSEELKGLTLDLIEEANKAAEEVILDGEGRAVKPEDFSALAVKAMESLAEDYEVLKTYYPQPKGVAASPVMSSFNLAGIYFPITVEANYNKAMPVSSQGFTACHELSHLSGFIREDEANFLAFAACRKSESPYFRYSGYLGALTYALNACYSAMDKEEYYSLCEKLSPVILAEYSYRSSYWEPYQKKVTYRVSTAVNDTYLKANNQTDGTKSYGRVVDLMLAEWKKEHNLSDSGIQ
ncbi:MAG: DUF3810 domain-containing protein [Firmicutes bacterium]|nr:DUF3810 domain-containing protein [[Eubacterium] siraeum]MCM1488919.1 DUF3810 domain-containing protein [Bacillota bacterium]